MPTDKPRRLGRGLEALLATRPVPAEQAAGETASASAQESIQRIPIAQIRPNPYQPRKEFRAEELAELESSLKESGLLQPISVRPGPHGTGYELIAGERRLRAATRLGWTDIPAVVRDIDDRALLTLALVENLQRADLNPMEEAHGYKRLQTEFSLTQQQVAEVVGKERSTIANILRLLNLPDPVQQLVQQGELTLGHARALLTLGDEHVILTMARDIVGKGLSVRDVEQRVRVQAPAADKHRKAHTEEAATKGSAETKRIADELRRHLQTDVSISVTARDRGNIQIAFYSSDDLERLLDLVLGARRERL
jgi:ParB family chromosome partitioning protein